MKAPFKASLLSASLIVLSLSCSSNPQKQITINEAHKKFLSICKNEINIDVISQFVGDTFWIYAPIKDNILQTSASREGSMSSDQYKEVPSINYADTQFKDHVFIVQYDIDLKRNYPKSYGYTSSYSSKYQALQQGLLAALNRSFSETDDDSALRFVILVIADITTGIEVESILYFEDIKHGLSLTQDLAQDEFMKRYVAELRGNKNIIGDLDGKHLTYYQMTMPGFLARQITNRINFKYQRSSHPPSLNTLEELTKLLIETFDAYDYQEYSEVRLQDLGDNSSESLTPSDISRLKNELNVSSGKFHVLKWGQRPFF